MMALKIESWENRGDDEVPFGFVYFSDGSRVVFTDKEIRSSNWGTITERHLVLARDLLARENVMGHRPKEG
jgi:hypothetical protein